MNGFSARIALKPYLETITNDCLQLSKQELMDIILGLAKNETASGRVVFLQKFRSFLPDKTLKKAKTADISTLFDDIQALKEAISERIDAIENGLYEELDDWDWEDAHYDDELEYISNEQREDLTALFEDAADLFVKGEIEDSKLLYEALFDINDELDAYEFILPELELDLREERARYARCVFETSDGHKRLAKFAAAMDIDGSNRYDKLKIDASYPLLQDVIDTREEDMPDLKLFYPAWKKLLLTKEALGILKPGSAREKISIFLIETGKLSNAMDQVLEGEREKFFSHPCDENLLDLLNEAVKQDKKNETLAYALSFFSKQKGMDNDGKSLHLKCLLMAGRLDAALAMVKKSKSLGWSYGLNTGLVFGAAATIIAGYAYNGETIKRLLTEYADKSSVYSYQISVNKVSRSVTFYDEILKGLQQTEFSESRLEQYCEWVFKIGRARVDDIVSNTHRGAYERAASVLGALAEIYIAKENMEEAAKLIHEYYKKNITATVHLKEK
jgi:hypothetical protein